MTINPFILHGEEVTPVRKLLYLKAFAGGGALNEYEITGNPVAFNTNVQKPLSCFTIPFLPVQSGTGDPSPENVRPISGWTGLTAWRSGLNMFNYNADNVEQETTSSSVTRAVYHTGIVSDGSTKFTLSAHPKDDGTLTNANINIGYFENGVATVVDYFIRANGQDVTPTLSLSAGREVVIIYTDSSINNFKNNLEKYNIQIELGESASPYAPYTGQSYPVTFPATGKNLIHATPYGGQLFNVAAGTDLAQTTVRASSEESGNTITVTVTHQWYGVVYSTDMLPPGTYNIHVEPGDEHCRVSSYVADKDFIALSRNAITSNNKVITLTETARIVVTISNDNSEPGSVTLTNLQVESGDSYTAYEPYTNTIYGGTLDAVNGVLTVEWGKSFLGDMAFQEYGSTDSVTQYYTSSIDAIAKDRADRISNVFHKTDTKEAWAVRLFDGSWKTYFCTPKDEYESIEAFKTAMQELGAYLVYELATPYEIPLSDITAPVTLVGDNTIWTDTNGENTIKYLKKG